MKVRKYKRYQNSMDKRDERLASFYIPMHRHNIAIYLYVYIYLYIYIYVYVHTIHYIRLQI